MNIVALFKVPQHAGTAYLDIVAYLNIVVRHSCDVPSVDSVDMFDIFSDF